MSSTLTPFEHARTLFGDEGWEETAFVELPSHQSAYAQLREILLRPLKIVMLYGRPGTGKTILLSRMYEAIRVQEPVFFYPSATFEPLVSSLEIYTSLTGENLEATTPKHITQAFIQKGLKHIIVLLDEAQLYNEEQLETIRLLSDSRIFKFVLALHKTDSEDVLAKEHFTTRIWESVELKAVDEQECRYFIERKLVQANLYDVARLFSPQQYTKIRSWTNGNLRETNKFMFKVFDILDYFYKTAPHKLSLQKCETKYLEMAALDLGKLQ